MDRNLTIAIITAIVSLTGILVSYITSRTRESLEKKRIRHEENRWMLELINKFECELFQKRISTYPEVFTFLRRFSGRTIQEVDRNGILEMADILQGYCYGEVSLYMLPDTREALVDLRNLCWKVADGEANKDDLRLGPRTRLLELLRRDLSYISKYHGVPLDKILQARGRSLLEKTPR